MEAYKGVDTLLAAWADASGDLRANSWNSWQRVRLIIAGPVARDVTLPPLPPGVELRDRRIADDEAEALFRSAAVLVLPYRDATQSALVAAAYAFGVPVIVTDVGALPEYVVVSRWRPAPDETGWVVPAGDAGALAAGPAGGAGRSRAPAPDGCGGAGVVRGAAAGRTGRAGQDVCLPVCRTGVHLR